MPSFSELLEVLSQPWKVDGEGRGEILWRKDCVFPPPLFSKGKKGPEDERSIRILFWL